MYELIKYASQMLSLNSYITPFISHQYLIQQKKHELIKDLKNVCISWIISSWTAKKVNVNTVLQVFSLSVSKGARPTNKPGVVELPLSNMSMLFISPLPVRRQHSFVTVRQEYSPTSRHGHCCYSEQTTPNQAKMEEGEGRKERTGKERWQQ